MSTGADVSHAPSVKQSVMVSGHTKVMVMVVVVFLEDMAHLKEDVDPMVVGRVAVIRGPDNVSIVGGIIISLRSVGGSLDVLNGHN